MAKKKTTIEEPKLLKALKELEAVAKGDALADADTEGGLSTEGKPLSAQAPSGKADTKKSRRASASSSSSSVEKSDDDDDAGDDASSTSKAFSASDMGSDDDASDDESSKAPPFKKKGKKDKKSVKKAASADSSSDDESSDDDDDAEKSLRDAAEGDEEIAKGIDVSPFLEAMVDQLSAHLVKIEKRIEKSIAAAVSQLTAHVDNRVAKSISSSHEFNARLAKAVAAIGETVQGDLVDMVKSLADQPAPSPRGKAMLSKGEVNQPPWSGGGQGAVGSDDSGGDFVAELSELPSDAIGDWLFKAASNQKVDPKLIMAWEADRYNIEALPVQVRKALANDLCK